MSDVENYFEVFKEERKLYRDRLLNFEEYQRMLEIAEKTGKITLKYIMRVFAETGIRKRVIKNLTVEKVKTGIIVYEGERKNWI